MDVRPIAPGDIARTAEVLADAFLDDPFTTWLFPARRRRERCIDSWTRQLRVIYVPKGHAYTTPNLDGVTLWAPPGGFRPSSRQQMRLLLPYIRILGLSRLPAAAAAFSVIDGAHPAEPHWYLSAIGVAPRTQRRGVGRALLEPMLRRADTERSLVYLETFNADNVAYYERFGFRVTGEADIAEGPHMWSMSRLPLGHNAI